MATFSILAEHFYDLVNLRNMMNLNTQKLWNLKSDVNENIFGFCGWFRKLYTQDTLKTT